MSSEPKLFKIDPTSRQSIAMSEVNFTDLGLQERRDIQEWIASNPSILGQDLLIVSKEFSGFDRTNERLDLLAVDIDGKLVVIELKRDDSGVDVHWQAIKYASYLYRVSGTRIVEMLASYGGILESDARRELVQHLGSDDDLNALNNDQRIILASHRFAPEVTSAALWLNEKSIAGDLVTCIQLTPYRDKDTGSLYIQANTIIPVPGAEDYVIGVGESSTGAGFSPTRRGYNTNREDEVTRFLQGVSEVVLAGLTEELKPDRKSRWAGGNPGWRYYHMWYSQRPWGNWDATYLIEMVPQRSKDQGNIWRVDVGFACWNVKDLGRRLAGVAVFEDQKVKDECFWVSREIAALDDDSTHAVAETLKRFIEVMTPQVVAFERDNNQQDT